MRQFLLAFALLALAACSRTPPPAAAGAVAPAPLKLASWNFEHLAAKDGDGCRPRTEADYAKLRTYVDRLGADVVAFAEVENKRAAERVFTTDRYRVVIERREPKGPATTCGGDSKQRFEAQKTGFAVRRDLKFRRSADLTALQLGDSRLRGGVDIVLRQATPLRLLAVHLKSGCFKGDDPANEACPKLFNQLPVLARWVGARAKEQQPFVILGDWNRRLANPGDEVFVTLDRITPLTLADAGQRARCQTRYPDFIDHIVLGGGAGSRLVPGSFAELTYDEPDGQGPSDHCPASVALN